jgi:HSP20 family protein
MLGMNRWTPFTELATLHRDLDSLFGRVFGESDRPQTLSPVATFTPAADVTKAGDKWTVSMALPGVDPNKVEINIVGRTLRVRGERPFDGYADGVEPVLSEIPHGKFEREFTLPEDIDQEKVQAAYRHGMLELTLPLKESAKPRRIEIQTTTPGAKQIKAVA